MADHKSIPPSFTRYATLTAAAALASLAILPWTPEWRIDSPGLFWLLAAFVLAGELLPMPVPRRHGLAKVTISTAFAFAILLRFGAGPATIVYATSAMIADRIEGVAPIKVLFNAAQYVLAVVAAAVLLIVTGLLPPVRITGGEVPLVVSAAILFFVVNHVLACVGAALLGGLPIRRYIRDDMAFQAWTAGCLLAFAPAVVASANSSVAIVPLLFVPMLAVYVGGRQAAINSHRAYHDALTELPNRLLLAECLRDALVDVEREGRELAVMILDLDDFKAINDTLGHEFGDVVLTRIAERLRDVVGERATLARLGGDEFAVIVEGNPAEAQRCAERLVAALDSPFELDVLALHVAASVGIACFPAHGRTVRELLRHADVALHCAKVSDSSCQLYAEQHDDYSIDRLGLAAQLRRGIDRGELAVHFQPKLPLRGDDGPGVEALARWNHPQLGCIGPDGFIPLAEQTGVIKPLTERVLESALAQCQAWRSEGLDVSVSVNVSTRSLLDHDLLSTIESLLERFELPPSVLQLEITESRVIADVARARTALEELRALGVMIAIDDFGVGFSSLAQLQQLPIDEIKIDRSFVMRMEKHRSDSVLVRSIIDLGRNLGLRVTAEGVENESTKCILQELGCDYVQGFHTGRPAAAEECRRYLEATQPQAAPALSVLSAVAQELG